MNRHHLSQSLLALLLVAPSAAACRGAWSSANAKAIESLTADGGYARIAPGVFEMGSPKEPGSELHEHPRHRVAITRAYELGRHEVTQREWEAVMGSNPSAFKGVELPVTNVSWNDVREFLARLQALDGGHRYRLPTEAEWEMACRAGGAEESDLQPAAWFDANSFSRPHPVGRLKPNAWGLHDMRGNISEWVEDWHDRDYYKNSPAEDPPGPPAGQSKVHRGGNWQSSAAQCRAAARGYSLPVERNHLTGLRLARVNQ